MKKNKSIISVDKLTLCYVATDELVERLSKNNELVDRDDCFRLIRTKSDEAFFADSFDILIKIPKKNGESGYIERKMATLTSKLRTMVDSKINYVWLYVDNWAFYEVFGIYDGSKCNWLSCIDYIANELGLLFNNITSFDIALDTNINFAKKIKRAQFNDDVEVILNGKVRKDKKEVLNEIGYYQTADQCRMRTLTIYVDQKKEDGLELRVYDKHREIEEKSHKVYIPVWNGLKNGSHRIELSIKNEHLKEFYIQKGQVIPDELLMTTLASQQQSESPLFEMLLYFSNRLLRFRFHGKPISIFQL